MRRRSTRSRLAAERARRRSGSAGGRGVRARRSRAPSVDLPQPDSPTSPSASPAHDLEVDAVDGAEHLGRPSRARRTTECGDRDVHVDAPDVEQRLSHRRPPDCGRHPRARVGRGCTPSPGPRESGAAGTRPRCSPPGRTGSAGGSGSRAAAARGRAAPPGSADSESCTLSKSGTERSRPSVYGCRGARKTSSTVPVSTICPAYMTASRSHVSATTARSCVTNTTLTPNSRRRSRSSFRIWSWMVTSSAVVGSSHRISLRVAREGDRDHDALAQAA